MEFDGCKIFGTLGASSIWNLANMGHSKYDKWRSIWYFRYTEYLEFGEFQILQMAKIDKWRSIWYFRYTEYLEFDKFQILQISEIFAIRLISKIFNVF